MKLEMFTHQFILFGIVIRGKIENDYFEYLFKFFDRVLCKRANFSKNARGILQTQTNRGRINSA